MATRRSNMPVLVSIRVRDRETDRTRRTGGWDTPNELGIEFALDTTKQIQEFELIAAVTAARPRLPIVGPGSGAEDFVLVGGGARIGRSRTGASIAKSQILGRRRTHLNVVVVVVVSSRDDMIKDTEGTVKWDSTVESKLYLAND